MIGQSIPRQDAFEKVTGRAQYAGDLSIGNLCHAKFLGVRLFALPLTPERVWKALKDQPRAQTKAIAASRSEV